MDFINDFSMAFGACAVIIAAFSVVGIVLTAIDQLNDNCISRFINSMFS
ncbi:MAG: hypothetical protein HUK12_06520 [Muribaculaceae bacterium]|nr:hypothetical protein [Muribaculaceae bacterium]